MARIKTKTITCKTFDGVDVITARGSLIQRDFADKCYMSVHKCRLLEDGRFIVIPKGFKVIDQGSFDLMQEVLA